MALLAAGTFGICVSGIPFLTTGKLVCADLFSAAALPPETVAAAVATYPSIIGMANLVGRPSGPVSDRLGCGTALAMMGSIPRAARDARHGLSPPTPPRSASSERRRA